MKWKEKLFQLNEERSEKLKLLAKTKITLAKEIEKGLTVSMSEDVLKETEMAWKIAHNNYINMLTWCEKNRIDVENEFPN